MADGEVTVKLDAETARRLAEVAEAAGLTVDGFVATLISDHLEPDVLAEAEAAFEEYERTGVSVDAEAALDAFVQRVSSRSAAT